MRGHEYKALIRKLHSIGRMGMEKVRGGDGDGSRMVMVEKGDGDGKRMEMVEKDDGDGDGDGNSVLECCDSDVIQ